MRGARALLVAALLLGACNGGGGSGSGTTLPPPVSTTDSTVPDYSVPAVIDAAYVEKVMAALDHVYGDAIRILARERKITQDFLEHLAAIYTAQEFEFAQGVWVRDVASGLKGLVPVPGDPTTDVKQLVKSDHSCILFSAARSFSATRSTPDQQTPQWFIALIPKNGPDPKRLNPTPWVIDFDGFKQDGSPPGGPCGR